MRFSGTPIFAARTFAALVFVSSVFVPSSGLLSACRAAAPPVQDVFAGQGTPGPFSLSWNHLPPNTETISVNGQMQLRSIDYTLDAGAGTVTFTRSLPANAAISIVYAVSPQSQRSAGEQAFPVSVDVMRDQHSYFSLDALGRTAAGTAGALTLGAGLGWHGSGISQLASRFLYTPVSASSTEADRTGMAVNGTAGAGRWGVFSLGFSRAGAGMDTGSDSAFQSGRQLLTLGSTLTPSKTVQAKLSFSRSDALNSAGNASSNATSTSDSVALTVTPTDKTKVQADLAQTSTGPGETTQTAVFSVDTQAAKMLDVSAGYTDKNLPGTASDSQTLNLKTVLTPSKTVSLQTSAGQSRLGAATTNQQSVTLALSPKSTVQLHAGFSLRQTAAGGEADAVQTSEATVGGTLRPLPLLTVSGSYKSRMASAADTNPNDLFDTSAAQVAWTPLKTLRLTGTYAQNPDDGTDTVQRLAQRGVGLETSLGALGLSGGCDWSRTYGTPDAEETIHAALGLRFSKATLLSVGYQTQQKGLDSAVPLATAYTVGFTHMLGDRFSLSFTGKRQQAATAASPDYNAAASLGMKF